QDIPLIKAPQAKRLGGLADAVRADPRCEQDDLSAAMFGMLLYGFALMIGRAVIFLDVEKFDAPILPRLTEHLGAPARWSRGSVEDANATTNEVVHVSAPADNGFIQCPSVSP